MQWTLHWNKLIKSTSSHNISLISLLILFPYTHVLMITHHTHTHTHTQIALLWWNATVWHTSTSIDGDTLDEHYNVGTRWKNRSHLFFNLEVLSQYETTYWHFFLYVLIHRWGTISTLHATEQTVAAFLFSEKYMHTWTSQKSVTPNEVKLVSSVSLQWCANKLLSPTSLPQQYTYKMAGNWLFHPKLHSLLTGSNNIVSQSFLGLCTFTIINNVYYRLHACAVPFFNCNMCV